MAAEKFTTVSVRFKIQEKDDYDLDYAYDASAAEWEKEFSSNDRLSDIDSYIKKELFGYVANFSLYLSQDITKKSSLDKLVDYSMMTTRLTDLELIPRGGITIVIDSCYSDCVETDCMNEDVTHPDYRSLEDWRRRNDELSYWKDEKERLRQGKELAKWRNSKEQKDNKEMLSRSKRDRVEKVRAKMRIKEQIEYDRIEKKTADSEFRNKQSKDAFCKVVTIRFQIPNGPSRTKSFLADDTLSCIFDYVRQEMMPAAIFVSDFNLSLRNDMLYDVVLNGKEISTKLRHLGMAVCLENHITVIPKSVMHSVAAAIFSMKKHTALACLIMLLGWIVFIRTAEENSNPMSHKSSSHHEFASPDNRVHIMIYPKRYQHELPLASYPYIVLLDTGNTVPFPLMAKRVFLELKTLGMIHDETLTASKTEAKMVNNAKLPLQDLILKTRLLFETGSGAVITLNKFQVVEGMVDDFNFGGHHLVQLGIKWRLGNDHVLIQGKKVPLI